MGVRSVGRRKRRFRRTTDSNHESPVAPNIVARDFEPTAPNQVWAGDVTYIASAEGWSYLAVLLDPYSRRVVGWAMSTCNDTALALAALERAVRCRHALRRRPDPPHGPRQPLRERRLPRGVGVARHGREH